MWSKGLTEETSVPGDAVESQHISALPFADEAALDQVCWVKVSEPRSRWLTTKAFSLNTVCKRRRCTLVTVRMIQMRVLF